MVLVKILHLLKQPQERTPEEVKLEKVKENIAITKLYTYDSSSYFTIARQQANDLPLYLPD